MHLSPQHFQDLYQGFCKTHNLWQNNTVFDMTQFNLPLSASSVFHRKQEKRLRLGQLAEQFVFNQLETSKDVTLIAENIQIKKDKQTLGELDAILQIDKQQIHLEIIYKFYVYDETLGDTELERWIGPNRKDSLIEKLTKLKDKQLPLLYSEACQSTLEHLNIHDSSVIQHVLFKAQLFVPYQIDVDFEILNSDCICGYYLRRNQIKTFSTNKFYIPTKLDWFLNPFNDVDWLNFNDFVEKADSFLNQGQSPLFWMKHKEGRLQKCFLIWW
ncbi:hypothetical protein SAMN04515667_1943 [Formosa sp. Hel1_31_208]|uniref:DUF1853 family protein n=1 Tax=Formosa sp. Hel1_31_208 TaxID=1798225 RepID=UPI000879E9AE|nr:DUF1853 family protein [Formosa sp. Hel1_31_208]SDS33567.1 hypothetical protein SAMN04515667_1943 [Formosa sp. Hel1_31_208]